MTLSHAIEGDIVTIIAETPVRLKGEIPQARRAKR
jgi:hypothetical protein